MSNEDHDNDTCPNYATATRWMSAYGYCVTENKRLSAENADLKDRLDKADNQVEDLEIENARLKAEVERLTAFVGADAIDREHGMCCDTYAQVERLINAGDALGSALILFELKSEEERQERLKNWAIAKYGEQRNG